MKTLHDLANLILDWEAELAYGSETGLLSRFVTQYDIPSRILDNDNQSISNEDFEIWNNAYYKYHALTQQDINFDLDCLF